MLTDFIYYIYNNLNSDKVQLLSNKLFVINERLNFKNIKKNKNIYIKKLSGQYIYKKTIVQCDDNHRRNVTYEYCDKVIIKKHSKIHCITIDCCNEVIIDNDIIQNITISNSKKIKINCKTLKYLNLGNVISFEINAPMLRTLEIYNFDTSYKDYFIDSFYTHIIEPSFITKFSSLRKLDIDECVVINKCVCDLTTLYALTYIDIFNMEFFRNNCDCVICNNFEVIEILKPLFKFPQNIVNVNTYNILIDLPKELPYIKELYLCSCYLLNNKIKASGIKTIKKIHIDTSYYLAECLLRDDVEKTRIEKKTNKYKINENTIEIDEPLQYLEKYNYRIAGEKSSFIDINIKKINNEENKYLFPKLKLV